MERGEKGRGKRGVKLGKQTRGVQRSQRWATRVPCVGGDLLLSLWALCGNASWLVCVFTVSAQLRKLLAPLDLKGQEEEVPSIPEPLDRNWGVL